MPKELNPELHYLPVWHLGPHLEAGTGLFGLYGSSGETKITELVAFLLGQP